jgi:hypothetical protein
MALPKKGLRKINVNGVDYAWRINRQACDCGCGNFRVSVYPYQNPKKYLNYFPETYKRETIKSEDEFGVAQYKNMTVKIPVTNKLVREIILGAIRNGWEESKQGEFSSQKYGHDVYIDNSDIYYFEPGILEARMKDIEFHSAIDIFGVSGEVKCWTYVPDRLLNEPTVHAFCEKTPKIRNWRYETFIIQMIKGYSEYLKIPKDELIPFFLSFFYMQYKLSKEEEDLYFHHIYNSNDCPKFMKTLKIANSFLLFTNPTVYAVVAHTEKGLIGLISDKKVP